MMNRCVSRSACSADSPCSSTGGRRRRRVGEGVTPRRSPPEAPIAAGRFEEAERDIAAGLRVAPDGEFYAGEYRLRLTAAAVHATRGSWDEAIAGLQDLLASAGDPGMRPLTHSLLVRLLARRGDPRAAAALLAAALEDPAACDDIYVVGRSCRLRSNWPGSAKRATPCEDWPRQTLEHAARGRPSQQPRRARALPPTRRSSNWRAAGFARPVGCCPRRTMVRGCRRLRTPRRQV